MRIRSSIQIDISLRYIIKPDYHLSTLKHMLSWLDLVGASILLQGVAVGVAGSLEFGELEGARSWFGIKGGRGAVSAHRVVVQRAMGVE